MSAAQRSQGGTGETDGTVVVTGALERFDDADGFVGYRSPLLVALGVPHVFTTRLGAGGRELDLAVPDAEAGERIARAAGRPGAPLVVVKQVHGAGVIDLVEREPPPGAEADALVSARSDVLVGVHAADCVSVLVAGAEGRRVAAIHAGWRGLVAGVIPSALARLGRGSLVAAIGPCLSRERFEVGPEVSAAFSRVGLGAVIHRRPGRRDRIDLRDAAARQLRAGGVERIDASDRCTYDHEDELWSYRRDVTHGARQRTGRLGAFVAARSGAAAGLPSAREGG